MAQVVVSLKTLDLRKAGQQPVTDKDVKTLQALLNIFLTAGDVGEDGTPILPLELDGEADRPTGGARFSDGGTFLHGRDCRPDDLEETHRADLLKHFRSQVDHLASHKSG